MSPTTVSVIVGSGVGSGSAVGVDRLGAPDGGDADGAGSESPAEVQAASVRTAAIAAPRRTNLADTMRSRYVAWPDLSHAIRMLLGVRFFWRMNEYDALEYVAVETRERWPLYAEYARLRAAGLRQQALGFVDQFATTLEGESWPTRWPFVEWIYRQAIPGSSVAAVLTPHPLLSRVIAPTLWHATQSSEDARPEAFVWLGRFAPSALAATGGSFEQLLRQGLQRFPDDDSLRRELAGVLIGGAEDRAHYLDESVYRGDPAQTAVDLTEAKELLLLVRAESSALTAELDHQVALLKAWEDWRAVGQPGTFPEWCARHGREEPQAPMRVYYTPKG